MKRILSLILLLSLFAASAASCADPETPDTPDASAAPDVSDSQSETVDLYPDNMSDELRFDGQTICILTNDEDSFVAENDEQDTVSSAMYERIHMIEDRFGVEVEFVIDTAWKGVANMLTQSVTTDSPDYEIYAGYGYTSTPLATAGYMTNLADMPYIETDQPWWGKKFIDAMAYKDNVYWLTGDIVLYYTSGIYCTYVNLTEWNNRFPDTDIYDVVRKGDWTMDTLREYAEKSYQDLNHDGNLSKDDFAGFVYSEEDSIDGMSVAAGVKFTEFDKDGVPQLVFGTDDSVYRFSEKLQALCTSAGSLLVESDYAKVPPTHFATGNVMFMVGCVFQAEQYMREMEDDYAIIPAPKLDGNQQNYVTTLHDGITIIGLPKTNTSEINAASCAVLEALAAHSYEEITPLYLDSALKNKYSRDPESAEMIDLIRENIIADFGFQNSATGFCNFFRFNVKNAGSMSSVIASNRDSWALKLATIIESLEAHAET